MTINDWAAVIQTPHEDVNGCSPHGSSDPMNYRYKVVQTDERFIGSTGDPVTDYYAYYAGKTLKKYFRVYEPTADRK